MRYFLLQRRNIILMSSYKEDFHNQFRESLKSIKFQFFYSSWSLLLDISFLLTAKVEGLFFTMMKNSPSHPKYEEASYYDAYGFNLRGDFSQVLAPWFLVLFPVNVLFELLFCLCGYFFLYHVIAHWRFQYNNEYWYNWLEHWSNFCFFG